MAEEGRIEEEMFLTSYLWEEAKHVETKMNELIFVVLQSIGQSLLPYGDEIPFGMMVDDYLDFGQAQFIITVEV